MSISSNYQLRTSSQISSTAESKTEFRISGRKRLGPEITASIISEQGHNCYEVNKASAQDKASRRITAHFFRATISYHLTCRTERDKTYLTGNHASCGNCESSHYSLTSHLKDDKLGRVIEQIPGKKLVTPMKRNVTYLKHRANFTEADIQFVEDNHQDIVKITQYIHNAISPTKKARSFAQTHFEKQLNATIDNPKPSNNVDSRFERMFRPKEDELCDRCFEKALTPEQSTKELVKSSVAYFQKSLENLEARKQELMTFLELNEKLQQFIQEHEHQPISAEEYTKVIETIKQILSLKSQMMIKLEGAPRIKNTYIYRQDYYTLKQIVNNYAQTQSVDLAIENSISYFKAVQSTLNYSRDINAKENPLLRLQMMIEETRHQLSINQFYIENPESIDQFSTMHFGIYENGVRRKPTDFEIEMQLLEMMQKEDTKRKALSNIINLSPHAGSKRPGDELTNITPFKRINSGKDSDSSPIADFQSSVESLN